ncbi:MAG: homoserine kinase [Microbacteriaceae bacterium]
MTSLVPVGRKVRTKVPATSANLGPGFDTLGLALSYYDELEAEAVAEPGIRFEIEGYGVGEVPTDETNLVAQAMIHAFKQVGQEVPGLNIRANNRIPHSRGMGSSGAAIVAGIMVAKGMLEGIAEFDDALLLGLATDLEGHPDNVAPALFGGLTIAWTEANGPYYKKLTVHRGVFPLVLVPQAKMSTKLARSLQPDTVPHEDAIFNVSRSSLLIAALIQSPELLLSGTEDRLHQNYRESAMPETLELVKILRQEGHAAVVSGAGPSVLVLSPDPGQRQEAAELAARHADNWQALMVAVDVKGATVVPVPVVN